MELIIFFIVLSVLVFFHELGHFLVARFLGVKVYVFSIGFGKKIISKEFKGTNWTLSMIPLGGYVKMKGQEDLKPSLVNNDANSYNSKTPLQRICILLAGPFANFLLAFLIYIFIGMFGSNELSPTIGQIIDNSPAQKSGLRVNDEIIKINNTNIRTWDNLSKIIKNSDTILKFYIKRDGKIYPFIIKPEISSAYNIFNEKIKKTMIGIAPAPKSVTIYYSFIDSLSFAYTKTYEASKMIFAGLGKMIQGIIPTSEIGGVISIGTIISQASQSSFVALLTITALISVNLGVLNLLPIPALDGGHIMFNIYEMIMRRKPSEKVLIALTIAGWLILFFLMGLGLYNDLNRLMK
ncbi:Membrane-associated zinc metalloprotease [hydrothermal vent metagenome]|uniref:Membrane-associated zinc metalloprotease n=1 Tax=hydrothermal vent metagenome TaxID=652676 RepID=A0A3B1DUG8_9ZZZZ